MHSGRLCLLRPQEMLANSPRGGSVSDEKTKNLDLAIAQIEKQYGKGSIMRLGNRDVLVPVSVIPTGSIGLDAALGVGGFPRGRVIEIFGPESGGKTTMALHVIAQAQKT